LHASEATASLHLRRVGIHGYNVIPTTTKFFKQLHTEIRWIPRDPRHRNTFLGQEILDIPDPAEQSYRYFYLFASQMSVT